MLQSMCARWRWTMRGSFRLFRELRGRTAVYNQKSTTSHAGSGRGRLCEKEKKRKTVMKRIGNFTCDWGSVEKMKNFCLDSDEEVHLSYAYAYHTSKLHPLCRMFNAKLQWGHSRYSRRKPLTQGRRISNDGAPLSHGRIILLLSERIPKQKTPTTLYIWSFLLL